MKVQKKIVISRLLFIAVSLVPLFGVFLLNWDPLQIFLVYCLETILVGVTNVIKMLLSAFFYKEEKTGAKKGVPVFLVSLFIICFFIIHYGIFVFVQTQIFFTVAGIGRHSVFVNHYSDIPAALGENGRLLILIYACYYFLDMIINFVIPGTYRKVSPLGLMFQPYARIFVQQFIVIIGSMFLVFGMSKIFMLIFIAVKLYVDIRLSRFVVVAMTRAEIKNRLAADE